MKKEHELIEGLKRGDRQALAGIYDCYYQDLYFYLLKFYSQEDLVQNAIHDLFVDLWEARKTLGEIQSLKAYLLVSSRRKLFRMLPKNHSLSAHLISNDVEPPEIPFDYSHEDFLIDQELDEDRRHKIIEAINQLSPRQKEAIYLRYYEKLSVNEISEVQGIHYQSVLNNLQRAYEVMRNNPLIMTLLKLVFVGLILY
ncbi:DNA-directed RNA polymerase sigma-70 factor [Echinicola pacifica]|uniref:DNA-directed RNA polymerase sigma-70 factor n=1 Tax=Echinicola pacifica TaxID=346377 RepID=A0A918PNB6_9BACT|nr:sigma-70 family RNA polymerase sigma factor [Echinicola pacifica]GGZ16728.1 DNA-directed RNA polymerase sigma-70 factor [Echinicola pacifica]